MSAAHTRSAFAIVDPAYATDRRFPEPDAKVGAPWLYGDGELECWRLARLRERSEQVCAYVGYPGVFHRSAARGRFRLRLNGASLPDVVRIAAVGDVRVRLDGELVFAADARAAPHVCRLDGAGTGRELSVELAADGEPPAILVEEGVCSTAGEGWEWSADGGTWSRPGPFGQTASGLPPHRVELPTVDLRLTGPVEELHDCGREVVGRVSFRARDRPLLEVGESPQEARNDAPAAREQDVSLEQAPNGRWRSRHPLALRYARIGGDDVTDVRIEARFHPVQYRGAFACSDERLTRIWMHSAYTLRLAMSDFVLDGPKRDRLPWVGDQVASLAANAYAFADAEIFRHTATALGRAGIGEGDLNGIVDFSLWWVILHDAYQRWFGDPAYLAREWSRIEALLETMESRCDADGLLAPEPDAWVFIAWELEGKLDDTQTIVPLQLLWHWALSAGVALAERRGERQAAGRWRRRAEALHALLTERAWDEQAGGWRLHAETAGETSRHANVLSVLSGAAGPASHDALRAQLLAADAPPTANPQWAALELTALARLGSAGELPGRIANYWGAMLDRGATTFWEEFEPDRADRDHAMYGRPFGKSLCHAWSSGPAALLSGEVLGIRPLADGWTRFGIEPALGRLEWACAVVPTPHGDISVEVEDGRLSVSAPAGTAGAVHGERIVGGGSTMTVSPAR